MIAWVLGPFLVAAILRRLMTKVGSWCQLADGEAASATFLDIGLRCRLHGLGGAGSSAAIPVFRILEDDAQATVAWGTMDDEAGDDDDEDEDEDEDEDDAGDENDEGDDDVDVVMHRSPLGAGRHP